MKHYNKIVIGIDQSYQDTGVTICVDNKLVKLSHITFNECKNNSEKRQKLQNKLDVLFNQCKSKTKNVEIIIERIRLQSAGFVNINYIKSIGALNAYIVDTAHIYNLPVYSVDTRAWKSAIVGTTKPEPNPYGIDPKKWPTIQYVIKSGHEESIKELASNQKHKGVITDSQGNRFTYNDNIADSACIALFGFRGEKDKLKLET